MLSRLDLTFSEMYYISTLTMCKLQKGLVEIRNYSA